MSRVGSSHITKQPRNYEIYNSFGVMGNEIFLHKWTFEQGICRCATITYHTILTDTRLLIRSETTSCFDYCCKRNRTDVSIFLRDIAEMRESTKNHCCCSTLCAKCCCDASKLIEVRGTFSSYMLHIPKEDMTNLQIEIPAAIGNHKLVSHY